MKHETLKSLIWEYECGELSGAVKDEVEKHLEECEECRKELEDIKLVLKGLRETEMPPMPEGADDRILAAVFGDVISEGQRKPLFDWNIDSRSEEKPAGEQQGETAIVPPDTETASAKNVVASIETVAEQTGIAAASTDMVAEGSETADASIGEDLPGRSRESVESVYEDLPELAKEDEVPTFAKTETESLKDELPTFAKTKTESLKEDLPSFAKVETESLKKADPLRTLRRASGICAALVVGVFGVLVLQNGMPELKGMGSSGSSSSSYDMVTEDAADFGSDEASNGAEQRIMMKNASDAGGSEYDEDGVAFEALEDAEEEAAEEKEAPAEEAEAAKEDVTINTEEAGAAQEDDLSLGIAASEAAAEYWAEDDFAPDTTDAVVESYEDAATEEESSDADDTAGGAEAQPIARASDGAEIVTHSDVSKKLGWHDFEILSYYLDDSTGKTIVVIRVYDAEVTDGSGAGKDIIYYYKNGVFSLK